MLEVLSEKDKKVGAINYISFSKCIAAVENRLLKRYCLYNYFDGAARETLNDFTINFSKTIENLQPEDFKTHFE